MGKFSRKNADYKLSEASAMAQIDTFLDGYGIDPDAHAQPMMVTKDTPTSRLQPM